MKPYYEHAGMTIYHGEITGADVVDMCVGCGKPIQ